MVDTANTKDKDECPNVSVIPKGVPLYWFHRETYVPINMDQMHISTAIDMLILLWPVRSS